MGITVLMLLLIFTVACGEADQGVIEPSVAAVSEQDMTANALSTAIVASAEPPYDPAAMRNELNTAVTLWQSHQIRSYELIVNVRQPTWNTQKFFLTVTDNLVTDSMQSCFPERDCILQQMDPELLTVEALFQTAETVISFNDPETEITFNKTYGYPNAIIYQDGTWVIDGFDSLDEE